MTSLSLCSACLSVGIPTAAPHYWQHPSPDRRDGWLCEQHARFAYRHGWIPETEEPVMPALARFSILSCGNGWRVVNTRPPIETGLIEQQVAMFTAADCGGMAEAYEAALNHAIRLDRKAER